MVEARAVLVDRKTLVQINATIIAGMLIFLTVGNFGDTGKSDAQWLLINIGLGFGFLIISIWICFLNEKKGESKTKEGETERVRYSESELIKRMRYAEIAFFAGTIFLFMTVMQVMYWKMLT